MVRFDGVTSRATPLLAVPTITAPLDGGTVAAAGFTVQFTLPSGSAYATIDLSSPGANTLSWTVVVPPDATSFTFVQLPQEATSPLIAGRTYTMALTAFRIDEGDVLLQQDQYRELTTHWYAIGAGERGVRALSRRSIQITAN